MELTNEFRVAVPMARAWDVLTDVELIAPCLPGAQLQEVEGDEYRGIVKVKVGPITAQYKGAATFAERDEAAGRIVLSASGRDTRGQGNASAEITAQLTADGDGTLVSVITDLTVTGKVAQFGRGVLADVSAKLLDQFVECLETKVLDDPSAPLDASKGDADADADEGSTAAAPTEPTEPTEPKEPAEAGASAAAASNGSASKAAGEPQPETPKVRKIDAPEPEPVDLLDSAGAPVLKRLAPIVTALILIVFLGRRRRRRRGAGS